MKTLQSGWDDFTRLVGVNDRGLDPFVIALMEACYYAGASQIVSIVGDASDEIKARAAVVRASLGQNETPKG